MALTLRRLKKTDELIANYLDQTIGDIVPVVLMYDGDEDNRTKPDVGSVFGAIVDYFADRPNVFAVAAQSSEWYYPKAEGANLETATGTPIETYVFSGQDESGKDLTHDDFTQSSSLAGYDRYEQVFIGPAGPIALSQLRDINAKSIAHRQVRTTPLRVTIIRAPNNSALDTIYQDRLTKAETEEDRTKIEAKISQRRDQPFGALYTQAGDFSLDTTEYSGLAFNIIEIPR